MKRRVRKKFSKIISATTDGVLGTVTDFTLLFLFSVLSAAKPGRKTMYDALLGHNDALELHSEINYQTIKHAIYKLTTKGILERLKKQDPLAVSITTLGKQRIDELIPQYHSTRPWDGHVYLISYDIPSTHNSSRNVLREYIRKTGGALLQDSLWINPYNPTILLSQFSQKHNISGTILVSKLGSDGAIGEEKLSDLINRVYRLDALADRYDEFLTKFSQNKKFSPLSVLLLYISILKDDPQLPFPLLPPDFPAEEAYQVFRSFYPIVHARAQEMR